MDGVHWAKVVMVVLAISLCMSLIATGVGSLVHRKATGGSQESSALLTIERNQSGKPFAKFIPERSGVQ